MNENYWDTAAQLERLNHNRIQPMQVRDPRADQYLPQPKGGRNAGHYIGEFAADVTTFAALARGEKAGRAHYERTGDLKEALWLGGIAGRRWNFYYMAWVAWLVYIVIAFFTLVGIQTSAEAALAAGEIATIGEYHPDLQMYLGWWLALPICWCALLVLHKRNVDFALARRGFFYHAARPLAAVTNWFPNWMLYATFVAVPFGTPLLFI